MSWNTKIPAFFLKMQNKTCKQLSHSTPRPKKNSEPQKNDKHRSVPQWEMSYAKRDILTFECLELFQYWKLKDCFKEKTNKWIQKSCFLAFYYSEFFKKKKKITMGLIPGKWSLYSDLTPLTKWSATEQEFCLNYVSLPYEMMRIFLSLLFS